MSRACVLATLLPLLALAGCESSGASSRGPFVMRKPQWDYQSYDRIAVLPVQVSEKVKSALSELDREAAEEAARQATFLLEDRLAANGQFTVLPRGALDDVLSAQDAQGLATMEEPASILPAGKITEADALLVGSLEQFALKTEQSEELQPVYVRDDAGHIIRDEAGQPRLIREEVVKLHRHEARVGGRFRIIEAQTGKVLYTHAVEPILHADSQRDAPPRAKPAELAENAAKEWAEDFYVNVAPIRRQAKFKSEMLTVALDYYQGRYDETKEIPATQSEFLVVVRKLPPVCNRTRCRVTVAAARGGEYFDQDFVWSSADPVRGVAIRVPVQKLKEAGGEKFYARLYCEGEAEPVLERKFYLATGESE